MNIGQAAKATGVSAKMIRYYEETGLIPEADRTASGYRTYSGDDIHRLHFVRRARDLGFSVAGISELLALWGDKTRQSADVRRIAQGHIEDLEQKIRDLQGMAGTLKTLVKSCHGDERPDCPILEGLETDHDSDRRSPAPRGAVRG